MTAENGNPLPNRKVYLVDEKRKVQQEAATGKTGAFEFRELEAGDHYGFMLEANDSESTIRVLIRDKDGKVLDGFSSDNRATVFRYMTEAELCQNKGFGRPWGPDLWYVNGSWSRCL